MKLKDLFDSAENGTLNYEQFLAAATGAKFVDLAEGNYVDKQKYTDDMAARDTRITALDETIKTRDTDLAKLQKQLEDAGGDTTKLGELNSAFAELQKQYDKDTKAYQKQLKDQAYKFAVNQFADQQKFTSQAAKRDFVSSMMAKNLQMEGDSIIGASDFVTAYSRDNADAFRVESAEPAKSQPHFVEPTAPQSSSSSDSTPFNFHFTGVRPH